jgi:hypothetical protein
LQALVPVYNEIDSGDPHYALGCFDDIAAVADGIRNVFLNPGEDSYASLELQDVFVNVHADDGDEGGGPAGILYVSLNQYWKEQVRLADQFLYLINCSIEFRRFVQPEVAAPCLDVFGFGRRALSSTITGGCILMRHGTAVGGTDDVKQIIYGVCKSFGVLKQVGLCHRDVRVSNIMRFNSRFQLIDYGMSGPSDHNCRLCAGARQDNIGARLSDHSVDVEETVVWHQSDDYEMFLVAVVKLSANIY